MCFEARDHLWNRPSDLTRGNSTTDLDGGVNDKCDVWDLIRARDDIDCMNCEFFVR